MNDSPETQSPPTEPTRAPNPMRKLARGAVVLFILWLFITQLLPLVAPLFWSAEQTSSWVPAHDSPTTPVQAPPSPASSLPAEAATPAEEKAVASEDKVTKLQSELTALREEIAQLKSAAPVPAAPANAAISTELESRISTLEQAQKEQSTHLQSLQAINALQALENAVGSGIPYVSQLDALRAAWPNQAVLEAALPALQASAPTGIAALPELQSAFAQAAREAMITTYDHESFLGRLQANLARAITIRKIGAQQGDSLEAKLARAEASLQRGDLAGSIKQLQGLDANATASLDPWLTRAKTRENAMGALQMLHEAMSAAPQPTTHSPTTP